jgi:hypothetical protein
MLALTAFNQVGLQSSLAHLHVGATSAQAFAANQDMQPRLQNGSTAGAGHCSSDGVRGVTL